MLSTKIRMALLMWDCGKSIVEIGLLGMLEEERRGEEREEDR